MIEAITIVAFMVKFTSTRALARSDTGKSGFCHGNCAIVEPTTMMAKYHPTNISVAFKLVIMMARVQL
jgi:hypothetical protein